MSKTMFFSMSVACLFLLNALGSSPVYAQEAAAKARITARVPTGSELAKSAYIRTGGSSSSPEASATEVMHVRGAFAASQGIITLKSNVAANHYHLSSQSSAETIFTINTSTPVCKATYARAQNPGGQWAVAVLDFNLGNINTQVMAAPSKLTSELKCPSVAYGQAPCGERVRGKCLYYKPRPIVKPELCKDVAKPYTPYYLVRLYSGPAASPNVRFYVETPSGTHVQNSDYLSNEVIFRFDTEAQAKQLEAVLLKLKASACKKRSSGGKA